MKSFAVLLLGCSLWLGSERLAQAQVAYVSYYHPAPVYSQPVVYTSNYVPYTTNYVPHTTYYAPAPAVSYQPVARVRTRYRPLLGGSVTRVRYGYAPVYHPPAPVVVAY